MAAETQIVPELLVRCSTTFDTSCSRVVVMGVVFLDSLVIFLYYVFGLVINLVGLSLRFFFVGNRELKLMLRIWDKRDRVL